jgi:hypothetical protein
MNLDEFVQDSTDRQQSPIEAEAIWQRCAYVREKGSKE